MSDPIIRSPLRSQAFMDWDDLRLEAQSEVSRTVQELTPVLERSAQRSVTTGLEVGSAVATAAITGVVAGQLGPGAGQAAGVATLASSRAIKPSVETVGHRAAGASVQWTAQKTEQVAHTSIDKTTRALEGSLVRK